MSGTRWDFTKRVFRVAAALLALGVLVGALATGSAAGQSIDVSMCQTINAPGTYELNQSISNPTADPCLEITAENVVLDGNGETVDGEDKDTGSVGIEVSANDTTVKNFGNVTRWDTGISVSESLNATLTDNTANNNGQTGIELFFSIENELTDNTANRNGLYGIWVRDASNFNNLTGNVARDNSGGEGTSAGIYLGSAQQVSNNKLVDNTATGDQTYGIYLMQADENELRENTANRNNEAGIYLTFDSSENELIDNEANLNGAGFEGGPGIYGIWLNENSNLNNLTGNDAIDNGPRDGGGGIGFESEGGETRTTNEVVGTMSAGIYLGGQDPVSNNTLIDNEVRDRAEVGGEQLYGIWLSEASENELIDNTANENLLYGIWLTSNSNRNNLTGNEAFDNGPKPFTEPISEEDEVETNQEGSSAGIYISAGESPVAISNNTLIDNEARDTGEFAGGNQFYGIWLEQAQDNELIDNTANENFRYGIWLTRTAVENELIGNVVLDNGRTFGSTSTTQEDIVEDSAGIYVGGAVGGGIATGNNELVDNTAKGSEYGIWIRNSLNNTVSESLAEENEVGIELEIESINLREGVTPTQEITLAGNTFTDDTSRNNFDWDFVSDVPLESLDTVNTGTGTLDTDIPVSEFPVTNLDIGESTKPDTTLSFLSPRIRLRSVRPPTEPDPDGLTNIGRYFEAEGIEENGDVPFLLAAVNYTNADVSNVDESTLELRRFNETAGEWQPLNAPALDQADNLVAGSTIDTSNFGVFGEPRAGVRECIDRRNLGRGQEDQECPFDRTVDRGGSREGLDRNTGRGGDETHRDSATSRRDRSRGSGRSR